MSRRLPGLALLLACLLGLALRLDHPAEGQQAAPPKNPSLAPVFGAGADGAWAVSSGTFAVAPDAALAKPVLTVQTTALVLEGKAPSAGPRELRALVRLRPTEAAPGGGADFYVARKDAKETGLRLLLTTTRGADNVSAQVQQDGKPLHDAAALSKNLGWDAQPNNAFTYYPRAYSLRDVRPGWPEDFRVRIEHDMAALPDVHDKWLGVRIQLRDGEALFWLDDRLVARKTGPMIHAGGLTRLELSPGTQLAAWEVLPWTATPGFVPVRLEGYANGRAFLGDAAVKAGSLPAGNPATVEGVPFLFPSANAEGNDHIDVGRSLYRQANLEGYMPSYEHRWIGSARRDPARIQLRIPNGQYDALYLVAAASEEPDHVPLVTAMFFRPGAGFAENFEARVPLATAQSNAAHRLPVTLADGKQANLWLVKIPLDPGRLSAFADMDVIEVELTKKVHLFRSYPDPFIYGWHQGGLPSAVHVYAATLAEVPVGFDLAPTHFGHIWTAPELPGYKATLTNRTNADQRGRLVIATRSYDGTETSRTERPVSLARGQTADVAFSLPVRLNGYHDLTVTLDAAGKRWTERRSFVRLAPDTRAPRWTEGKGALFGYWSYHGGHYTPKAEYHVELMTRAGARTSIGVPRPDDPLVKARWAPVSAGAWEVAPQPWAAEEPVDPKKYADYQKAVIVAFTKARAAVPAAYRPDHVYFFPEPHVSQRLTEGNLPTYWQAPEYQMTPDEKKNLRMFFLTAKCAAEAIRRQWPDLKILVPWGDALFVPPLLRAGFPRNLIDGSGIDTPGFERLPEMQLHQIAVHRLYELRKEYEKAGIPKPRLQYCEGIFVPTEPGAVSYREQMDLYNRWTLLSMAYGVERFYSGWFAFDCGNYYGSEHYGGCGIQRRIPYCDPKPAYAAYATMTDKLDQANFDGWLPTGSLTTYCLRFEGPRGLVYALWTLRGKRPVTLTLAKHGVVHVTDAMNNTRLLPSRKEQVTFSTDPSVVYVTDAPPVLSVSVGEPDHSDAQPARGAKPVADLGDGSWHFTNERDKLYEHGTFAVQRFPGKFSAAVVSDPARGKVLRSTLEKQGVVHELMPWYNVLAPKEAVELPGAPAALGLWVKGASDWGRVIYVLRDAKGERWTSIGTQDQYNCDDVHSWSAFNFDGWRYVRFELPGHTGYDSFRKHGTTWWRSDGGDGIVDLPLRLERIIVEQRTHVLYVNDVQPAASNRVEFGKLFAEYAAPEDATPEAVRVSRVRMPLPQGAADLPNPIAEMQRTGAGAPTAITKLEPPTQHNDGTTVRVHFREVAGAKSYFVWVSAHADGRGAVNLTPGGLKNGDAVGGLRPALPLTFWVTYQDARGKAAKPSAPATVTLVDTFTEK
ncbi:MAG TPA: hypothetical protein VJ739_12230 [Gemmataceae bacterium]|nr:hypothetical protein [Gemmataceae bacterium]